MTDPPADLETQLQAEIAAAEPLVDEVRALFDDLSTEMRRRYNFEVALLRATPAFRALLRELVDYAAERPAGRDTTINDQDAPEAA